MRFVKPLLAAIIAVLGSSAPALAGHHEGDQRPNVIVILVDDLGYNDLGFMGANFETPNIDKLAAEGMTFSQAYISHPYCGPSRAGLLTGQYQAHIGHEYNAPDLADDDGGLTVGTDVNETLISQAMQAQGYKTVAIGKWHQGSSSQFLPHNRGFDVFYGFGAGGRSFWPDPSATLGRRMQLNDEIIAEEELDYLTDDLTDFAIDYVTKESGEKPFFIYLSLNAPHAPNHATAQDLAKTEHIMYGDRSVYAAMVVGIDRNIGKLVDALEAKGIRDNTLILFLSDNGGRAKGADNTPLRGHKGLLYEGGIRTPFVANMPSRIAGGGKSDAPIVALDIFPTLVEMAGGDMRSHPQVDGRSLWPLLDRDTSQSPHERLFWRVVDGQGYAIRDAAWKLVKPAALNERRLYNLLLDPAEENDVSGHFPEIVSRLQGEWDVWNEGGKPTLWTDAHGPNVAYEYCDWRNARADALAPGERSAARCPKEMMEARQGASKNANSKD